MSQLDRNPSAFARSLVAELIGTFFLLTVILAAPASVTFAAAGATLLIMVVAIGKTSGAHLNPAVTTALVTNRQFPLKDGLVYVVAQVVGALLAIFAVDVVLARSLGGVDPGNNAFWAELIGTFLLAFVVSQVTVHQVPEAGSALGIGIALALGVLVAGPNSGGVLNPAIGLALLLTGNVVGALGGMFYYLLAPLVAGLLAGQVASYLTPSRLPKGDPRRGARSL
ncbi:MAG: aquaporin [Chloroflexota bacterium]|nr:aquaporin [Chloroflexota bacterium]